MASARLVRWVISRSMATSPSRIAARTRSKSSRVALRLREQSYLLPVEIRVPEGDRLVHHAHEHVAPAMADEVEAPLHRTGVAGCVEDDIEALAGLLGGASLREGHHGGDRGDDFRRARRRGRTGRPRPRRAVRRGRRRGRSGRRRRRVRGRARSPPRGEPRARRWRGTRRRRIDPGSGPARARGWPRAASAARSCRRPGGRRARDVRAGLLACRRGRHCAAQQPGLEL